MKKTLTARDVETVKRLYEEEAPKAWRYLEKFEKKALEAFLRKRAVSAGFEQSWITEYIVYPGRTKDDLVEGVVTEIVDPWPKQ